MREIIAALVLVLLGTPAFAQTDAIDIHSAVIVNAPDVRGWPITTALTSVDFDGTKTRVDFTKKDGPNRWPDVTPAGWTGPLEFTLWLFVNNNGTWVGSGFIQFWAGRDGSGNPGDPDVPSLYAEHWYYAQRWAPIYGHGPLRAGEQVGFMVTSGNQRDSVGPDSVHERSNIVLFAAQDRAHYDFPAGSAPVPVPPPVVVPTPAQPVPVPAPAPPSTVDLSNINQQLALILSLEQDTHTMVTEVHAEVRTFAQQFGTVMAFVGKYVAPAIGTWVLARQAGK